MKNPNYDKINKIFENINSFKDFENNVSNLAPLLEITENQPTDMVCQKLYENANETNTLLDENTKIKINQYLKLNYVMSKIIPNVDDLQKPFEKIKEALGIEEEPSNAEIAKKLLENYDNLSHNNQKTCRILVATEASILTIKHENIKKFSNTNKIITYPAKDAKAKIQNKHLKEEDRNLYPNGLKIELRSLDNIKKAANDIKSQTENPEGALKEIYKQLSKSGLPAGVAEFKMLHLLNEIKKLEQKEKNPNEGTKNLDFMAPKKLSEITQGNLDNLKKFTNAALKTKDLKNLTVQIAAKVLVNTGNFSGKGLENIKKAIKGKDYTSIEFKRGFILLYKRHETEPKYLILDPICKKANEISNYLRSHSSEETEFKDARDELSSLNSANCKKIEVDPKTKTIKITHADSTTTKLAKNSAKSSNKAQAENHSNGKIGPQQQKQNASNISENNRLKEVNIAATKEAKNNMPKFNRQKSGS